MTTPTAPCSRERSDRYIRIQPHPVAALIFLETRNKFRKACIEVCAGRARRFFTAGNRDIKRGIERNTPREQVGVQAPAQAVAHDRALVNRPRYHKDESAVREAIRTPCNGKKRVGQAPAAPQEKIQVNAPSQPMPPLHTPALFFIEIFSYDADTVRRARPFARRRESTRRPVGTDIRLRNPCVRLLFFFDG